MTCLWTQVGLFLLGLIIHTPVLCRSPPQKDDQFVHHIEKRMINKLFPGQMGHLGWKSCFFLKGPFAAAGGHGCQVPYVSYVVPATTTQAPTTTTTPTTTQPPPRTTNKPYYYYSTKPYYQRPRPRPQPYSEYEYEEDETEDEYADDKSGNDWENEHW